VEAVHKLLEAILETCKEEQDEQRSTLELAQKLASAEDALPGISVCHLMATSDTINCKIQPLALLPVVCCVSSIFCGVCMLHNHRNAVQLANQ
jgi:hypothetical protein